MLRPLILLAVFFALALPARADEAPTLTLGIPRPLSAETASSDARALEGYFSSALRRKVEAKTFDNYEQLSAALAKGEIDLAWITPLSYVNASKSSSIFPIAKALRHGLYYRSVFFTAADSKATKLSELKGRRVAWVDQGSAAGYLFARGMLLQAGLKPATFFGSEKFYGDHKSVCAAVLGGEADVGATFANGADPLETLKVGGCIETHGAVAGAKVKAIAVSDRIPNEVVAARAGFDESIAAQLAGIFANLSETESGRKLLQGVFRADGFGLALEQDFDAVRLVARSLEAGKWIAEKERANPRGVILGELPTTKEDVEAKKASAKTKKPAPRKGK